MFQKIHFSSDRRPCPSARGRGSYQVHLVLVDEHPLVHPADDKEGVERDAVLLVEIQFSGVDSFTDLTTGQWKMEGIQTPEIIPP